VHGEFYDLHGGVEWHQWNSQGRPLVVAANQGGVQPHLLLQAIFFGEGAGGLAESILFIVLFW
jgi:hypothetical protein